MGQFYFKKFCTQFRETECGSQGSFIKPVFFFRKTLFTLIFKFQPYYLIIPRSKRQIYVDLDKISTGSEKVATGSESDPCHHLLTTTGLLSESGWTRPSEGRNYKLFFVLLEGNPILPMTPRDGCVGNRIRIIDNRQLILTVFFTSKKAIFDKILLDTVVTLSDALFKQNNFSDDFESGRKSSRSSSFWKHHS